MAAPIRERGVPGFEAEVVVALPVLVVVVGEPAAEAEEAARVDAVALEEAGVADDHGICAVGVQRINHPRLTTQPADAVELAASTAASMEA